MAVPNAASRGDNTSGVSRGLWFSVFGASVRDYAAVDLAVAGVKHILLSLGKNDFLSGVSDGGSRILFGEVVRRFLVRLMDEFTQLPIAADGSGSGAQNEGSM